MNPVADMALGMTGARVVMAGVRLGIFDLLAKTPASSQQIATELGLRAGGLELLLTTLESCGHIQRFGDDWFNTEATERFLVEDSEHSATDLVRFNYDQWDLISELERRLVDESTDLHARKHAAGFWERYLSALAFAAGDTCAEVARKLAPLAGPIRVLDVGGGHGAYCEALCAAYPELQAEVLDLPPAIECAPQTSDRIVFRAGDMSVTPWGSGFDLVLLFNVTPHLTDVQTAEVLHLAGAALKPGGRVAILQPDPARQAADARVTATSSLLYYLMTGRPLWTERELLDQLDSAGFLDPEGVDLATAPGSLLLIAHSRS